MSRHYSKVFVELPDGPRDPPFAIVHIDCRQCGESEVRIHMKHLGTVLRTLSDTVRELHDDGFSDSLVPGIIPSTPEHKRRMREYLNATFPGWVIGRKSPTGRA